MQIKLTGAFGIAFVVLKLTEHIEWSWWWVTCPFWGVAVIKFIFYTAKAIDKAEKERKGET